MRTQDEVSPLGFLFAGLERNLRWHQNDNSIVFFFLCLNCFCFLFPSSDWRKTTKKEKNITFFLELAKMGDPRWLSFFNQNLTKEPQAIVEISSRKENKSASISRVCPQKSCFWSEDKNIGLDSTAKTNILVCIKSKTGVWFSIGRE